MALRGTGSAGPQQEPPRGVANAVSLGAYVTTRTGARCGSGSESKRSKPE
jgi:hypothetical protein